MQPENSLNRKEQKRLEAELRQQTAPLRKKIQQLEIQLDKWTQQTAEIESQLADTALYSEENKARLTALLSEQTNAKKQQEQVEFDWLDAQQQLEEMLAQ